MTWVEELSSWVGNPASHGASDGALELRDRRLAEARALLCCAEELITDVVGRHRPGASGAATAVELELLSDRLAASPERYDGWQDNPVLLLRAAVHCAGEEWERLAGLLPGLRVRISAVCEAIAATAVQLHRLGRVAPLGVGPPAVAPSSELVAFALEDSTITAELQRRVAHAGAYGAWAAADGAHLPSLAGFLR